MGRASLAALLLALGCASAPSAEPGSAVLWGYVQLVPKAGVDPAHDDYSDRRVRDAKRIDYSQTGYAIAYVERPPAEPATPLQLVIEPGPRGPELRPALGAVLASQRIAIENRSAKTQIVSAPGASWLAAVAPGEAAEIAPAELGELAIHVLGADAAPALVWVSPGAFAVAGAGGRYELRGLAPGSFAVRAWHPRLPPSAAHAVELGGGQVVRLDLEIGVDRREVAQP